ncbi:MAG: hypothetical protein INR70_24710 [Parafilimonas terrae]|nr:hypothetical protein [Parafilimonas terrae]
MQGLARRVAAVLIACTPAAAATVGPQSAGENGRPLTGQAAWAAIVGNTVEGTTPDGPYTDHYADDGTMAHVDRDGRSAGRWSFKGEAVCFTYPDQDEVDCLTPQLDGAQGAFVDSDGTRYPFTLLPGNPKGL